MMNKKSVPQTMITSWWASFLSGTTTSTALIGQIFTQIAQISSNHQSILSMPLQNMAKCMIFKIFRPMTRRQLIGISSFLSSTLTSPNILLMFILITITVTLGLSPTLETSFGKLIKNGMAWSLYSIVLQSILSMENNMTLSCKFTTKTIQKN